MYGQSYTQGTDYQIAGTTSTTTTTGATTTNYTTEQYQYQYQLPTTTTTTTTTKKYTTTTPVTYTQQYTTSQPVYTTSQQTYTTSIPTTTTTTVTTSAPPQVQLLRRGSGISPNEQNGIISTSMAIFQNGITPISNNTAARIKKILGGDWLVIVYPKDKPIDFNMTCVQGNDYLYFTLDNLAYQVCRLR